MAAKRSRRTAAGATRPARPSGNPASTRRTRSAAGSEPAGLPQGRPLGIAGVDLTPSSVVITFDTDRQLVRKLRLLLEALEPGAPAGRGAAAERAGFSEAVRAAARAGECMSIIGATEVVVQALEGRPFEPSRTLGTTYLTQDERDGFRVRVRRHAIARGCQIELDDIPADAGATQGGVRDAVQQNAG